MNTEKQSEKQCKKNSCDYLYYKWLVENGQTRPGTPDTSGDPFIDLRGVIAALLGRTVTVSTDFAPVTGILSSIQTDYIVITEAAGTVVFVPFNSINSVREPI
ncbi:DUF2642 domain-containing protein [Peribacillus simplex]|uniref:DUF2642 domain-containing protein n=1 Tax=Peribacillus simplex TaxID=1478 RepID=A0A9X9EQS3_9BACI|nr:DUF2642 domain-containing protein [Peribacillus simplex]TKH02504.1 DUF2642 domain-containing protein [Peribacillus simplex]TKH08182.1 DUF2642 domain-containing protein [Peribacillus simplex]